MPLSYMQQFAQFILWRMEERDGRMLKMPVDARTGHACDAHDPSVWLTYGTALTMAGGLGCNVGFVFTQNDPFFFVDIDNCAVEGGWSPIALELISLLPGAAVEVSQSGHGLHIFGTGAVPTQRKIKYGKEFDLYTERRFVALTYNQLSGDCRTDCTAGLHTIVSRYLTPDTTDVAAVGWTDRPVPEWTPITDEEVVRKACASASGAALFGGKVSFVDLWNANAEVLALNYPDDHGERPYDASSADAALAQHLAFWTGKDCEAIKRIMMTSGLKRDKWTKREDYLKRTIGGAVARQQRVYTSGKQVQPIDAPPAEGDAGPIGGGFIASTQQEEHFKGCVYVRDEHAILVPDGVLLNHERFKVMYGNAEYMMDHEGKTTKDAWECFTDSRVIVFPKVVTTCFRPELPCGTIIEEEGIKRVNTYKPQPIKRTPGDASPFINHLHKMLPNGNDAAIMLAYMAAIVQHPGVKFQWAPLLQGCEGNGKTLFIKCVQKAVSEKYTHLPNPSDLGNKFNAWVQNKVFIGLEEIYVADRRELIDALKPLITNNRIEIQGKGSDQKTGDNRANFIMCSNHKDAIRKTANDRRYCVLYTAQQSVEDMEACGMIGDYFPDLYNWLRTGGYEIVNNLLFTHPIQDEINPATSCHRAPVTSSTEEAITMSRGRVEQEIMEAVDEGRPGFAGGWVSSIALNTLLEEIRATSAIPPNKRKMMMQELGYTYHPALKGGRVNNIIPLDNGKPRLFIKRGHLALNLTTAADVASAYSQAQGSTIPGNKQAQEIFKDAP